jgi:hypothetical protein
MRRGALRHPRWLTGALPAIIERAQALGDHSIRVGTVSQALVSALRESQHCRLFRS